MNKGVKHQKCIGCYMLGYFRVEELRGGNTTYFHPETMCEQCRAALAESEETSLNALLQEIPAQDGKVRCLSEMVVGGKRVAQESAYDELPCEGNFSQIRELVARKRICPGWRPKNHLLPYSHFQQLLDKKQLDATCKRITHEQRKARLVQLAHEFQSLRRDEQERPQQRGHAFEALLVKLFELYNLSPQLDVRNPNEQIDFTFNYGMQFFLAEAKWHQEPIGTDKIRDFWGKLTDRPPIVAGLVISISGFTSPAIEWLSKQSGKRTVITATLDDLNALLSANPELPDWLDGQIRHRIEHP